MTAFGRPFEITQVPDPEAAAGAAVVKAEASGICRSDWHLWNHDWTWVGTEPQLPTVLGHEVGGTVVAVGEGVTVVGEGDLVTVPFTHADGTGAYCRQGCPNLCDNLAAPGVDAPRRRLRRVPGRAPRRPQLHQAARRCRRPDRIDARLPVHDRLGRGAARASGRAASGFASRDSAAWE